MNLVSIWNRIKAAGLFPKRPCVLWLLLVVFAIGCEKDLDYDLGNAGGLPVLYSFIQPDTPMNVSLSKSVSILAAKSFALYENATLEFRKNGIYVARVSYPKNQLNYVFPDFKFMAGDTVSVDVYVDGERQAGAFATLPKVVDIDKVDTVRVLRKQPDGRYVPMMKTTVHFTDPVAQINYYQLQLFFQSMGDDGKFQNDTIDFVKDDRVFYDPEIGASSFQSIDFQGLFADSNIDGMSYGLVVYLPIAYFAPPANGAENKLIYRLYHVDALYYELLRARIIELSNQDLPLFNKVNMPTNVDNGYGVVAALSHSEVVLAIE